VGLKWQAAEGQGVSQNEPTEIYSPEEFGSVEVSRDTHHPGIVSGASVAFFQWWRRLQ
jgi:hypothetical protein